MSDNNPEYKQEQVKLRLNTWLLPFLILAFAIFYVFTGFRGWLVFFIGSAGVWLLALLWVITLRRSLHLDRKMHLAWATVGESVQEELKLVNRGWLPALWVEIVDDSAALTTQVRMVSDVGANTSRTRYLSHMCRQRGLYMLGPTRLRTGDPFGIYTLTIHDQHSDTILVTPPLLPMTNLGITPGGWAGDQRRRRTGLERQIGAAGVRDYLPGDSLRRIHWHATAHLDTLMVRQLEASASEDWWIFVDLQAGVQAGSGQDSTLELSIVLAASLAVRGLKERRRVGLALAGPKLLWLEPRADPAYRWRILRALAMAEAGEHSLADLLAMRHSNRTATLITITPSTDPGWVAVAGSGRGAGQVALLVDPVQFGGEADQSRVISALAYSGIPYHPMPRKLLLEAYPSLTQTGRAISREIETRKRYLQQEKAAWQSMD